MPHTTTDLPGAGTKLQLSVVSLSSYVDIPQTFEIGWDGFAQQVRNPTTLASNRKRKKPGLPDFGSLKFKIYFDPNDTIHAALLAMITGGTPNTALSSFKLIYADGMATPANIVITGFLSEFNESGIEPDTGTLMRDGTIEVDNAVYTAGS